MALPTADFGGTSRADLSSQVLSLPIEKSN